MIECPKCKAEIEPSGNHEEDSGEHECEDCGFLFTVTVEYDPTYSSRCVTHDMGDYEIFVSTRMPKTTARFCKHCGHCELGEPNAN